MTNLFLAGSSFESRRRPSQPLRLMRMGLWSWQKVTEIECVEVLVLRYPLAFLHQFAMHKRDLADWSAKTQAANTGGNPHQFAKARVITFIRHSQYTPFHPQRGPRKATLGLAPDREVARSRSVHNAASADPLQPALPRCQRRQEASPWPSPVSFLSLERRLRSQTTRLIAE